MHALVTGIGIVSPYGKGRDPFWQGVSTGQPCLRPVTRFDASAYRNNLGGEVPEFDPGVMPLATAFAVSAAREALDDAGFKSAGEPIGLVMGTNFGPMQPAEAAFRGKILDGRMLHDLSEFLPGSVLRAIRESTNTNGPQAMLSLSCASGAAAIATALEWIRAGRCEIAMAGGFDELSETAFAGLSALRAITRDTIRPFDKNRGGTIFSEGAGILLIESEEHARKRKAEAYCSLLGRGLNNDAFHMTAPDKTGKGIAGVMRMALADAKIRHEDIMHINCHGTGTKYNDMIETTAIESVFGPHTKDLVVTANKSLFGHAMGAAGALEAAATCLTVRHGLVPPTLGCQEQDPDLDLNVCLNIARQTQVSFAMTNSYGLGGTNASLVLGAA